MESEGKSRGSSGVVLEGRPAGSRCGDCAKASIGDRQQAARGARGLAGIVATGGRSASAAGDPLGDLAGHPAPPFATADLSVFPSGNHLVRFLVRVPGLADRSGVAGHGSDTGGEFGVVRLFMGKIVRLARVHREIGSGEGCEGRLAAGPVSSPPVSVGLDSIHPPWALLASANSIDDRRWRPLRSAHGANGPQREPAAASSDSGGGARACG